MSFLLYYGNIHLSFSLVCLDVDFVRIYKTKKIFCETLEHSDERNCFSVIKKKKTPKNNV